MYKITQDCVCHQFQLRFQSFFRQWLCRSDTTSCRRFSSTSGLLPFSGHALLLGESQTGDMITSPSMVKARFLLTHPCRIIRLMSDSSCEGTGFHCADASYNSFTLFSFLFLMISASNSFHSFGPISTLHISKRSFMREGLWLWYFSCFYFFLAVSLI